MRRLVLVCLFALLLLPTVASADGDPASDVLLGENVFFPYAPPTSPALTKALNSETAAAKQAGFPLKVALIASPIDLGVVPSLFNKPQQYAEFLDQEISFQTKQPLLVVMPAGYGVQGLNGKATALAATLPKPRGKTSTDLAAAAAPAITKLAAASGHPLSGSPAGASAGGGGSSSTLIVVVLAVAAVFTAGALIVVRRRQPARRS